MSAAKKRASVFLAAQEPYLGEDLCGTYRFFNGSTTSELGQKLFGNGQPTPMLIKRTLDQELISNKIGFLYSTYVTDLVYDENKKIAGVVISNRSGRQVVLANTIVDSTGSADIAIAAGAGYSYTDGTNVAVQGAGMPPKNPNDFYNNTDWTFTDDSDMIDVWATFIVGKEKFKDQFDLGKLPQTRERRRMNGDFTVSVLDVYNGRTYPDTISIHESSFDTHGFTVDPFFVLKPPAHSGVDVVANVPFRALLPKGLEGIVVTGLGASAHRDAMPVIRMQPCLQNQGYAIGIGVAMAAANNQRIRYIDIKKLQKKLIPVPETMRYAKLF